MRGGRLENICVPNIEVGQFAMAGVSTDFYYEEEKPESPLRLCAMLTSDGERSGPRLHFERRGKPECE